MNEITSFHNTAMELADEAQFAKLHGKNKRFIELSQRAFESEKQASLLAVELNVEEPTRSVLLRSAATLAVDCKQWREAEELISLALSEPPPAEIAEELRDISRRVHFGLKWEGLEEYDHPKSRWEELTVPDHDWEKLTVPDHDWEGLMAQYDASHGLDKKESVNNLQTAGVSQSLSDSP